MSSSIGCCQSIVQDFRRIGNAYNENFGRNTALTILCLLILAYGICVSQNIDPFKLIKASDGKFSLGQKGIIASIIVLPVVILTIRLYCLTKTEEKNSKAQEISRQAAVTAFGTVNGLNRRTDMDRLPPQALLGALSPQTLMIVKAERVRKIHPPSALVLPITQQQMAKFQPADTFGDFGEVQKMLSERGIHFAPKDICFFKIEGSKEFWVAWLPNIPGTRLQVSLKSTFNLNFYENRGFRLIQGLTFDQARAL